MFDKVNAFADAYPAAYQTLYQAKPITCSVTGTIFDALPAPCAVILDVSVRSTVILPNSSWLAFHVSISSFLIFLKCKLLEKSADIPSR